MGCSCTSTQRPNHSVVFAGESTFSPHQTISRTFRFLCWVECNAWPVGDSGPLSDLSALHSPCRLPCSQPEGHHHLKYIALRQTVSPVLKVGVWPSKRLVKCHQSSSCQSCQADPSPSRFLHHCALDPAASVPRRPLNPASLCRVACESPSTSSTSAIPRNRLPEVILTYIAHFSRRCIWRGLI